MKENNKVNESSVKKKDYIPPTILVEFVEMEEGIASGSSSTTPPTTNGITDPVPTEWEGSDDTIITISL